MRYKWMGGNDMSKRFGRNQKRKLLAEIARLNGLLGEKTVYNGAKLSWPDLWTHFGMYKHKRTGKWFPSYNSPVYVVNYLKEYGYEDKGSHLCNGFHNSNLALLMLNSHFAKLVVINDPELARKLRLIKE